MRRLRAFASRLGYALPHFRPRESLLATRRTRSVGFRHQRSAPIRRTSFESESAASVRSTRGSGTAAVTMPSQGVSTSAGAVWRPKARSPPNPGPSVAAQSARSLKVLTGLWLLPGAHPGGAMW